MVNYVNKFTVSDPSKNMFNYILYGVVVHSGNMYKGHYFCNMKNLIEFNN